MASRVYDNEADGERVNRPLDGLTLYQERPHEFRSLGDGRYEVPSRSFKGQRHEVNIEDETCTCKDRTKGGNICAHIYAAVIAASKPIQIKSRDRSPLGDVMASIDRLGA